VTPPPSEGHDPVAAAFAATPRGAFLPHDQVRFADLDRALPIGHGQTCSQPSTVRDMLRALGLRPGMRVLDVGSGSGWTTALLAALVGPAGEVVGVEVVPALVVRGRAALASLDRPWARIEHAEPGVLGRPTGAPYDAVLVSAEATELPQVLVDQLADGGVMVVPVQGSLLRVRRRGEEAAVERLGDYVFVPLVGG
jgi:protein-L-isoaspartate(D-aspartate) O-methyltransferase